jgi:hypothetical protein
VTKRDEQEARLAPLREEWERGLEAAQHQALALESLAESAQLWKQGKQFRPLNGWQRAYLESRIEWERYLRRPPEERERDEIHALFEESARRDPGTLYWEAVPGQADRSSPVMRGPSGDLVQARSFIETGDIPAAGREARHVHTDVLALAVALERKLGGPEEVERLRKVAQRGRGRPSKAEAKTRERIRRAAWSIGAPADYEYHRTTALAVVLGISLEAAQRLLGEDPLGVGKTAPPKRPERERSDDPNRYLFELIRRDLTRAGIGPGSRKPDVKDADSKMRSVPY